MGLVNVLFALSLTDACELDTKTEEYVQVPQDEQDRLQTTPSQPSLNASILSEPTSLLDKTKASDWLVFATHHFKIQFRFYVTIRE